jgi:hypothetical protein
MSISTADKHTFYSIPTIIMSKHTLRAGPLFYGTLAVYLFSQYFTHYNLIYTVSRGLQFIPFSLRVTTDLEGPLS